MAFWLSDSLRKFLVSDTTTAKFLLVGSGEIEEGKFGHGIFCGANDPFTARRALKEIQTSDAKNDVKIMENSPELLEKISSVLTKISTEGQLPSSTEEKTTEEKATKTDASAPIVS